MYLYDVDAPPSHGFQHHVPDVFIAGVIGDLFQFLVDVGRQRIVFKLPVRSLTPLRTICRHVDDLHTTLAPTSSFTTR